MAVDHGLGGKDSAKNKLKRAMKAKKVKMAATADITASGRKNEIVFDDAARTKWLTGFRSRKQSRRKYGLAMQVLKEKKARQQVKKDIRTSRAMETEQSGDPLLNAFAGEDDMEDDEKEIHGGMSEKIETGTELTFNDERTKAMFGGDVSVVIDEGIATELDNFHQPDLEGSVISSGPRRGRKEPSALEKAMKVAGEQMQKKYYKQGGKNRLKKKNGTALLHKAMGSGVLGKNSFKGSAKKRK